MKILFIFVFISVSVFSQNEKKLDSILFSEMLGIHHTEFQRKSTIDYHRGDYEAYGEYFSAFVDLKLKGTTLDNFKVFSLDQRINFIYEFKKPMYLMSYASWCVPSNGELEALAKLVEENSGWMDFILILWDKKEDAQKFSRQFPSGIKVIYVNELYNTETKTIKMLKHKLGLPVSLTISSNKTILNIRKNTQIHPSVDKEIAELACYEDISRDLLLLQKYENF